MIFHQGKSNDTIDIVDGQQRTITLSLLIFFLIQTPQEENQQRYPKILEKKVTILSSKAINKNFKLINTKLKNYSRCSELKEYIEENVLCTYIKTDSLDEAFMLFDSQNTRGKALSRKDLLKVHHIRYIDKHEKQKISAKKWEEISKKDNPEDDIDNLDRLFIYLSIIRKSVRGELEGKHLEYLDVYREFVSEDDNYKLNNYNQPPLFHDFTYDVETDQLNLTSKPLQLNGLYSIHKGVQVLPFEIVQSIEGGEKFFWFSMKYKELYDEIVTDELFNVLDDRKGKGNYYLRKIYKSLIILFVDKFGDEELDSFSIRILILIFYYRYKKVQVKKEGVVKFQWNDNNILDIYKLIFLKYSTKILFKEIDKYVEYKLSDGEQIVGEESVFELVSSKYGFWLEINEKYEKEISQYLKSRGRKWKIIKKK